jgi:hypothetical protein
LRLGDLVISVRVAEVVLSAELAKFRATVVVELHSISEMEVHRT